MYTQSSISVAQTPYLIPFAYLLLLVGAYVTFRNLVRNAYLNRGRITFFPLLLETLVCALYCNFPYLYLPFEWPALPVLPERLILRIPGISLLTVGILIMLVGMGSLGFYRLFGLGSPEINQSGLYGLCRNPQILGFFIYTLGFAIMWPSWYALAWVTLFLPVFHMMVMTEEEYLLYIHGDTFRRYCERVPRYFPLPGRRLGFVS